MKVQAGFLSKEALIKEFTKKKRYWEEEIYRHGEIDISLFDDHQKEIFKDNLVKFKKQLQIADSVLNELAFES